MTIHSNNQTNKKSERVNQNVIMGTGVKREMRNPLKTSNSYEFTCFKRNIINKLKVLESKTKTKTIASHLET